MKNIEKELDRLVQMLHLGQRCWVCGKPAECVHHIISRRNKLFRYDLINLQPLCFNCHRLVHDGKIDVYDYIPSYQKEYIETYKNTLYKDYLFELNYTEDEYLKVCKKALLKVLRQRGSNCFND